MLLFLQRNNFNHTLTIILVAASWHCKPNLLAVEISVQQDRMLLWKDWQEMSIERRKVIPKPCTTIFQCSLVLFGIIVPRLSRNRLSRNRLSRNRLSRRSQFLRLKRGGLAHSSNMYKFWVYVLSGKNKKKCLRWLVNFDSKLIYKGRGAPRISRSPDKPLPG